MNRVHPFLCIGGIEVANGNRLNAYLNAGLMGSFFRARCEDCAAIDGGLVDYVSPLVDDAPWVDPMVPASVDFIGILPERVSVAPGFYRNVVNKPSGGGSIGRLRHRPRVMSFIGILHATTTEGMVYGESWLRSVLSGNPCAEGCDGDDVIYLPTCPEDLSYDEGRLAFRRLIDAGVTDGPEVSDVEGFPAGRLQRVTFQMVSSAPYIYYLPDRELDHELIGAGQAASLTTTQWGEGGTFVIEIENDGTTTATDIVIEARMSLDGSCPVTGDGTSVPLSWTYTIPELEPEARILIDGTRRKVLHYDPSDKYYSSGVSFLELPEGPLHWPDVGPCTTMCVEITKATGDVIATVDSMLREV